MLAVFGPDVYAKKEAKGKETKKDEVATVNGSAITQTELDTEIGRYERQIAITGRTLEPEQRAEVKKKVLDSLVDRELLIQQSNKLGVKVSDTEINDQIAALRKRFPSEQEFNSTLDKMKMSEADLKAQFGQDMTIKKMIEQEVAGKITISDEDSKTFYDGHPDLFKTQEMVRASHILVKVDPKASDEDKAKARAKIVDIQKRVKKGDDFGAVAKEVSECPSSAKEGDLGFFQRGQMVRPFEDAAFGLKAGTVSDIVETQFGFHLIKATDKKEAGTMAYADIKERIGQHLKQEKVDQQLTQYVEQLRSSAKIEYKK
jgi:peptidyl-prolyl cis-trans isomerase C